MQTRFPLAINVTRGTVARFGMTGKLSGDWFRVESINRRKNYDNKQNRRPAESDNQGKRLLGHQRLNHGKEIYVSTNTRRPRQPRKPIKSQ